MTYSHRYIYYYNPSQDNLATIKKSFEDSGFLNQEDKIAYIPVREYHKVGLELVVVIETENSGNSSELLTE